MWLASLALALAGDSEVLPNANVQRWVRGAYEYRALTTHKLRGRESFLMTVHPDGSRTMRAFTDIFSRGVTANVVMRVDRLFRPQDAFVSIYTQGQLKGSGFFSLHGTELRSLINGPAGTVDHTDVVPQGISLITHPLALDGWHQWLRPAPSPEKQVSIFNVQGGADFTKPMSGLVQSVSLRWIGEEDITVPAGKFHTHHFVLDGQAELWVSFPEHLLVRSVFPKYASEYLLSDLQESRTGTIN